MKNFVLGFAAVAALSAGAHAAVLANWTFETSVPTTAGPFAAEAGINAASSQALGNTGGTYSNPVGNGTGESFSSNGWDVGDYYQFTTSTTGYEDVVFSFDANGSGTGPRDFKVAYSTNGTTFTDVGTYSIPSGITWSAGAADATGTTSFSFDLSAVAALENASTIYLRVVDDSTTSINGSTVASGGTSRIDNVVISASVVPEPATLGLLAGMGVVALRRRSAR